jgi:predicted dienelactone hydrolase
MNPTHSQQAAQAQRLSRFISRVTPAFQRWVGVGLLSFGAVFTQAARSATVEAAPQAETAAAAAKAVSVDPALFTTQNFQWKDAARDREVPAKLYLPVEPLKTSAVPMVVFSHGIGGSKDGYSYLGRYFRGTRVCQPARAARGQRPPNLARQPAGPCIPVIGCRSGCTEALNRVQDVKFALDRLLVDPVGKVINVQRLVAAGHSYGANTTMLLAGAKVDMKGQHRLGQRSTL